MNTERVGVLGAGNWGQNIVRTLHEMGCLAAIADPDTATRSRMESAYPGIAVGDDLDALLSMNLDAIAIATPAPTHFDLACKALDAGLDVFVEKPMTLTANEGWRLDEHAKSAGRVLMVGHLLLFQPAIQFIADYLRAGRLGHLHSIHQSRLKLGRVRRVEDVLWSFGVHDLAVLDHLVGQKAQHVHVQRQFVLQDTVADDVHLHLAFPNGVQAHLRTCWLWPTTERSLTVIGSQGMLVFDEVAQTVTLHRKSVDEHLVHHDEGSEVVFSGSAEPLRIELEHFLECVRTRSRPIADAAQGARVVELLERASRREVLA